MRHASRACWRISAALCLAAAFVGHAAAGTSVRYTQAESLTLGGGTFDPPPSMIAPEGPSGDWVPVALPHAQSRDLAPSETGGVVTTWYRVRLHGIDGVQPHEARLYLPRWQTIGHVAVYGDGRLLFRSIGGPVWNGFNHPLWIPLVPTSDTAIPRTVLVRMDSLEGAGGGISSVWAGSEEALAWRYRTREWLQAQLPNLASAAFLAIGLFSFAVWMVRRRDSMYALFFASSVLFYVRALHYHWGEEKIPLPDEWFSWMTVNANGWLIVTVYFFAFRLHRRRYPWLERSLVGLMAAASLISLPPVAAVPGLGVLAPLPYIFMLATVIMVSIVGVWASWQARSADGLLVSIWNTINIPTGIHDLLLQNYRISLESIYLLPYTAIGLFVVFMYVVFRRYVGAIAKVEEINVDLARALQDRERELAKSYEQLRRVEQREMLSRERQRLMQDMHDGLGSSLMSALRMVERGRLEEADVAGVLKECIDDLKLAIDSLEPVETDLLLLLATLRFRLAPRLEGSGLVLAWEVKDVPGLEWLEPRSALHILRILQEVFTNVIKHTQATRIGVSTSVEDDGILVAVEDNGQGFSPQEARANGGKGLANLSRRAEAIGGRVSWASSPGSTRFTLWLPIVQPGT
ncbi:MAG: ATP-binding protein [Burkholderiaceae bacterium]